MSSPHTSVRTKDYMSLVSEFPPDTPCTVFHMLRFNETAQYPPDSSHATLPTVSGREAFWNRYVPAGTAAAEEMGITPAKTRFFSSKVVNLLQSNDVPWDVVTARDYASFEEYAKYQSGTSYQQKARPHRDAALKDWSLVACIQENSP